MKYLLILVELALLLTAAAARSQQPAATPPAALECRTLTGRITDPFAYPLTGATIMLRSPGQGFSPEAFSTNSAGQYIITARQAIPRNTIMEVTAVGYATLALPLVSCQPLDLTMMPLVSAGYKAKTRNKKAASNGKVR